MIEGNESTFAMIADNHHEKLLKLRENFDNFLG
jgi:hypothetical protein